MAQYDQSIAARYGAQAESRTLFGQVMGLVAIATAFAALGAYLGRDMSGGSGIIFMLLAFACVFGLNFAVRRSQQLATALLFALGLLLGISIGPIVHAYAASDPGVVYQAAGATALFVGALGATGYAIRRDLTVYARFFFFALLALIVFGLISLFVAIPGGNMIYCLAGLAIFGGFVVIDFNRLRQGADERYAPVIAASIFLDIFNVFLFFLQIFGGGRR